jgi:hypothetical protein
MRKSTKSLLGIVALPLAVAAASVPSARAACGPCQPRASTTANPCAAKNSCAAKRIPCNPCGAKKPGNPCAADGIPVPKKADFTRPKKTRPYRGDRTELAALGRSLFADAKLSTNEMSCNSCHSDFNGYGVTFKKPYPHVVAMPKDVSGAQKVTAEQMVQFCLIRPMMAKPLPWSSKELAALTAYVEEQRKQFAKR